MANTEVGSAYVTIYPQTDGNFSKQVGKQLDKGTSGISAKAVALGNIMSNAFTAVASRAGEVIGQTISDAFWDYASYEQLVGGVDKLFGDASKQVQSYAAVAYKTSGMSANAYMEQVTSFSASLINSLGGDTAKAADVADVAMRAISDNVNTFGSNAEDVQNAIQGISRENYTMLDNLRLGYAGNKSGFQELIADANAYAESIGEVGDMTEDSFADAIRAIDLIQQKQGIAGTTAKEASSTLEGSLNQANAAWENFLTSFGTDAQTIQDRAEQLYESLSTAGQNVLGYVGTASANALEAIASAIGMSDEEIQGVKDRFAELGDKVAKNVLPYIEPLAQSFDELTKTCEPFTSQVGPALETVFRGIIDLISSLVGAVLLLGKYFFDAANDVITAAGEMWEGAGQAIDDLNNAVADGWQWMKQATSDAWNTIKQLPENAMNAAKSAVSGALNAIKGAFSRAWTAATSIVSGAANKIRGAISGISSVVDSVTSTFGKIKDAMTKPIETAKGAIKDAMDAIGNLFPLNVGNILTNIHVPTITVDGGEAPFGIGGKGRLPHIGVSWNAEGGFTDGVTLFGAGEKDTELLLPRRGRLMDDFAAAVSSQVRGDTINITVNASTNADANEIADTIARRMRLIGYARG